MNKIYEGRSQRTRIIYRNQDEIIAILHQSNYQVSEDFIFICFFKKNKKF